MVLRTRHVLTPDRRKRTLGSTGRRVVTRAREVDRFAVHGVAERLASYAFSTPRGTSNTELGDPELVERASTLLLVMPPNQSRETIEELLSPNDRERGRQAVDALIDAALAVEDEAGHLRGLN